jgi:hypothetical protein
VLTSCDDYGKKMTMYYKGEDVKETEVKLADSYFVSHKPLGGFYTGAKRLPGSTGAAKQFEY